MRFPFTTLALLLAAALPGWSEPAHPGAAIYQKLCAECHGDQGQGVMDKYDEPLHGNRSVESLAKRIARTMPDDNVGACVGEDARQVAEYIFNAFYSPSAAARLRPPEFDLARLTIAQYRTSVADLIGRFGWEKPLTSDRGLRAHYSGLALDPLPDPNAPPPPPPTPAARKEAEKKDPPRAKFDRVDPQVAFSFAEQSPDPAMLKPVEFSARWEGSVIAEETGVYEFIVRSENGFRLWVNQPKTALIDAWVAAGEQVREEKKTLFLLGGRPYPLVLEFFKFKEKTASIQLLWRPPHGAVQPIPTENLWPERPREVMVVSTPFPPDDRSEGYERGTGISKEWDTATTEAALQVAEYVDARLDDLSGSKVGTPDRLDKLKRFSRRFVEAAFRRPLSEEEATHLLERSFGGAKSAEFAVKRVIVYALKSPRFLYPQLPPEGVPDDYEVATRLAADLWDSLPDTKLLEAAAQGKLRTREAILAQATRLAADPRARAKLRGFFEHWLELERAEAIAKDPATFPGFDAEVLADLRVSLERFLDGVVWSDRSDYRELLQADYLLLNDRLGRLYGKEVTGPDFQKVAFDPSQRAGVITHPYLLAALASSKQTSPIHRGVFLTRNIVGMTLKPPPKAVSFEDAKFDPHLTMREKVTELTKNANCMGCHGTINPLGFSLENYDAIGRWRTSDGERPIDSTSEFATDEGQTIRLTGARDVVKYAAENAAGHRAFIHQLFHHTVKQAVEVYGPDTLETLRQGFTSSGFNVRQLLIQIATVAATEGLPEPAPTPKLVTN